MLTRAVVDMSHVCACVDTPGGLAAALISKRDALCVASLRRFGAFCEAALGVEGDQGVDVSATTTQ